MGPEKLLSPHLLAYVVTLDHLPEALASFSTASLTEPSAQAEILIVDSKPPDVALPKPVRLWGVADLQDPTATRLCRYYTRFEQCNALRAFFIHWLIECQPHTKVLYVDADIVVLRPLNELWQVLDHRALVITPHLIFPESLTAREACPHTLRQWGWFNSGMLGASSKGVDPLRALDFLKSLQTRGAFFDPPTIHAGQEWLEALPLYFSHSTEVCRLPAYNVAYWNLHERALSAKNGTLFTHDSPLATLHLSGFDPESPRQLFPTRPQATKLLEAPVLGMLQDIASEYADQVQSYRRITGWQGYLPDESPEESTQKRYAFRHPDGPTPAPAGYEKWRKPHLLPIYLNTEEYEAWNP